MAFSFRRERIELECENFGETKMFELSDYSLETIRIVVMILIIFAVLGLARMRR
jgi:Tfp pilus assembly protein PilO